MDGAVSLSDFHSEENKENLHIVKYEETDIIVKSAIIIQSQTGLRS